MSLQKTIQPLLESITTNHNYFVLSVSLFRTPQQQSFNGRLQDLHSISGVSGVLDGALLLCSELFFAGKKS